MDHEQLYLLPVQLVQLCLKGFVCDSMLKLHVFRRNCISQYESVNYSLIICQYYVLCFAVGCAPHLFHREINCVRHLSYACTESWSTSLFSMIIFTILV